MTASSSSFPADPTGADTVTAVVPPARETLLLAVNMLPASPQILARLHPMLVNMDSDVQDVTELLRRDAALTARIIRIANSVAYNPGEPLASIEEAVMRIGLAEVYRVTGFAVLAQVSNQQIPLYGISGAEFRENSLLTALIMEELAKAAQADPRSSYTAGLLRSTGKIALDRATKSSSRYELIMPYSRGPLAEWEVATFGCTSGDAAALVLEAWRFPAPMIEAVRFHCQPGEEPGQLTRLLSIASAAAERCGHGLPGEYAFWEMTPDKFAVAGLSQEIVDEATRAALEAFGPVRAALA